MPHAYTIQDYYYKASIIAIDGLGNFITRKQRPVLVT